MRMLIVDDHPTMRETLRFVFAAAGIRSLVEATTCQEAVDAAKKQQVDVVLLDISLGEDNGLDALRQIKAHNPTLPVLLHSWHDNPGNLALGYSLGASGFAVKGADKNALLDAARRTASGESVWTADQLATIPEIDSQPGTPP